MIFPRFTYHNHTESFEHNHHFHDLSMQHGHFLIHNLFFATVLVHVYIISCTCNR